MLIFYYGLLFLATLCICDDVATFFVIALVDFLLLKAIWQDYEPFVAWRKKKYEQLITLKTWGSGLLLEQWEEASLLKKTYIIVAGVIGFALLILFFVLYSQIFLIPFGFSTIEKIGANFALAFLGTVTGGVALFSGFLAILRSEEDKSQNKIAEKQSKIADKQAITAEQGLITDRINKATEGLGKINQNGEPLVEGRIGALYALERIAQDSIRDHIQIMEILCAYIRHASLKNKADKTEKPTEDIQAALTIIGRRDKWPEGEKRIKKEQKEGYRINLTDCYLYGARLSRGNLIHATLVVTNLTDAWFNSADLSDASLGSAILKNAWFQNMTMNNTVFSNAITDGVFASEGDFSGCTDFTPEQLNAMFFGIDVKISNNFTRPEHWPTEKLSYSDFKTAYHKWQDAEKIKAKEAAANFEK